MAANAVGSFAELLRYNTMVGLNILYSQEKDWVRHKTQWLGHTASEKQIGKSSTLLNIRIFFSMSEGELQGYRKCSSLVTFNQHF